MPAARASKASKTSAIGVSAGAGERSGIALNVQTAANAVAAAAADVNEVRNAHADTAAEIADGQQTDVSQKSAMKGVKSSPGSNDVINGAINPLDSQQQLGNAVDNQDACSDSGVLDWQKGIGSLPDFPASAEPNFRWGLHTGEEFAQTLACAYSESVHWKRNIFRVPSGNVGKQFVRELTSLLTAYAQGSAMESIALKAAMVACTILLQKPHPASKCRDHVEALERRLRAWRDGDIHGLMREGRTIQNHLSSYRHNASQDECNARVFSKLVFEGKIHAALRFLSENHGGGVLDLDQNMDEHGSTVRDILLSKHPAPGDLHVNGLLTTNHEPPEIHPILFDRLTGRAIRNAALRTQGSAGPSGVDAAGWRRLCTAFHKESNDLCAAIAAVSRRLSKDLVDPAPLEAFLACRLIPLDKKPGVRPIGVCEVLRRIIGKATVAVVRNDVRAAAGPLQLCCGQYGGCEAAVHAMRDVFQAEDTDAVIFVDASNAFNNLNRKVALYNIQYLCPAIAKMLINCYRSGSSLFVGGTVLWSREGTTQGDPLAMIMFGLATVPLIERLKSTGTVQCWFADDASSGGKILRLRDWWEALLKAGPLYGYFPNPSKTYLLAKPETYTEAIEVFSGTNVEITCTGRKYLGGAMGSSAFELAFMTEKAATWKEEVEQLAKFAKTQPHAAYAAFTHGLIGRWTFAARVSSLSASEVLKPLEEAISQTLIPALTTQAAPSEATRRLLALPARWGGMGIVDPVQWSKQQQTISKAVCQPLVDAIKQDGDVSMATHDQRNIKQQLRAQRQVHIKEEAEAIIAVLPETQRKCALSAQEKGTSSWLGALPIKHLGFSLHKGAFWDAVCLRYGWDLRLTPLKCRCGEGFEVNHVLTCRQGGFHTIRHNELRDTIAGLLQEVCPEVTTEPLLQPLSGERLPQSANRDANARLDIRAKAFWDGMQDAFFDVRVFHPFAPSYRNQKLTSTYRQHELKKRLEYGQRVREIEHGCFTPLVCTTNGGTAPEATVFLKRLGSMLSEKRRETYSVTMCWLRCVLSFCLLRSSLRCLRASPFKNKTTDVINMDSITEAVASGRLQV